MFRKIVILLTIVTLLFVTITIGKPAKEKHCTNDEVWTSSNATCEPSCGFPDGKRCLFKIPGCICKEGLLRNKYGKCVNSSDCGNERRGPVVFRYTDDNV
ncbi:hypothetical protein KPH14_011410 [Odynerus spinipes]|uniref:TIL domain-containing protein n=1 Tax=Odynerus spinipes TaxID=1348599 RepID=A0AAD9VTJ4_9HYME|nr:hypothetical protein KPH14_011410 [Odynerus spinipes]